MSTWKMLTHLLSLLSLFTAKDITHTGAPATLPIFNNEKGFSAKNIESVCSVGRSTKKGNRKRGYIGEKGIGFKSVFLITSQPHIFSNGYQLKFDEAPCPHCNLGYIVPEWVENLTLSDIKILWLCFCPSNKWTMNGILELHSHGCYILNSSFDKAEYDHILEFLGVKQVANEWYAKCIQGSDIAASVSDEVYLKLLLFLANGWSSKFHSTSMKSIPVIKYVGLNGNVSCSIQKSANSDDFLVCMASDSDHTSWLISGEWYAQCALWYSCANSDDSSSIHAKFKIVK